MSVSIEHSSLSAKWQYFYTNSVVLKWCLNHRLIINCVPRKWVFAFIVPRVHDYEHLIVATAQLHNWIVHGPKGKLEGKWKGAKCLKLERPGWLNLGPHAFLSTSTCINFFEPISFFDTINYSPWSQRKIWPVWANNRSNIFKTREATPTKPGAHAYCIALYVGSTLFWQFSCKNVVSSF